MLCFKLHVASRSKGLREPTSARAFALTDLLAALAAMCLIAAMLLPTLSSSRRSSMGAQSANLIRRHAQRQELYAAANQDVWVNPFDGTLNPPVGNPVVWVPGHVGSWGWSYTSSQSESYGYFWLSHLLYAQGNSYQDWRVQASPGDWRLIHFIRRTLQQPGGAADRVFPTSYWYSPVFWQSSTRFASTNAVNATQSNRYLLRRNTVADVVSPSRKVLLFENSDFDSAQTRQWNYGGSKPYLALCDGSVKKVGTSIILAATDSIIAPFPPAPGRLAFPSGAWGVSSTSEQELNNMGYGSSDGFNWNQRGITQATYWRTRMGVQGADVL